MGHRTYYVNVILIKLYSNNKNKNSNIGTLYLRSKGFVLRWNIKKENPFQIYIRIVITELVLSDKVIKLIVGKNNKNYTRQKEGGLVRVSSACYPRRTNLQC